MPTSATRKTTRVVAVEDDPRYRASLEVLLRYSGDFELVDSFASPEAALTEASTTVGRGAQPPWDLVLMDVDLPGMSGNECTRRMKALVPGATVVMLTVSEDRASILDAICAGADGYLLKRTPADGLLAQLRAVLAGGSPLSAGIARTVLELLRRFGTPPTRREASNAQFQLTDRELEVLQHLAGGLPYKGVAAALGVSLDTVRSHIRSIYAKLQVHSVAQAVSRALRAGLV
jgi:DNA-binding NarL/FixJ family response regulator